MDRAGSMVTRAYRLALRLCPRAFRRRWGAEMRATFDALCRDAAARGRCALAALLVRELGDLARAASAARRLADPDSLSFERREPVGTFWQDLRYAGRLLRRQPGFAAVAILTLALGIGATTAVFTVVNGVLLRPLPYGQPDRLVLLLYGRPGRLSPWFSPRNFEDVTRESQAFKASAALAPTTVNLTGGGEPERIDGARVSWNYFDVLQVTMGRGRGFVEGDGQGDGNVVVISDGLWRRRFGGRPDAVGTILRLDGRPCTIVGVAPPFVKFPGGAQFWQPLIFTSTDLSPNARGAQWVNVLARLAPDISLQGADAAVHTVAQRLSAEYPKFNLGRIASVTPLQERMVRNIRMTLYVLLGAVGFVLLIACVNVANLLLARAQARGREVAVRAALGAGRTRLVRQFLSESLLLGTLGAVGGLIVAYLCLRALAALGPAEVPRLTEVAIDIRVIVFTTALAVTTSVVFGLAPAIASTGGVVARLVAGGRIVGGGSRLRKVLVVSETALAVILLVGAGLLLRSYDELQRVNPGFDPEHVVTFNLSLPAAKYPTGDAITGLVTSLVDRLRSEPDVVDAAAVFGLPFADDFSASTSFTRPGDDDVADSPSAGMRLVTPDYFKTMAIPIKAGRGFDAHDDANGPEVVLINETAAARYWPGENPIGRTIHIGVMLTRDKVRSGQKTIVGIVGDVKYASLDSATPPEVYLPYAQHPVDTLTVVARSRGEPLAVAPALGRDLAALDRELPAANVQPMTTIIGSSVAERRFTMLLLAAFAGAAVVLAAVGIYGVLAYLVGLRTQEIGVRLAIGASPGRVVGLFLREGLALSALGLGAGLVGAFAATRTLASLLYGVTATDPATFALVGAVLGGVSAAASYLPARRAARVDPMAALRTD